MKKLLTLFTMLLLCIGSTWAQYYKPVSRVTTFESGKSYMLYNTCVTNGDNRTGFIYVNTGNTMQKNVGTRRNPKQFTTASTAYLWRVTTGSDNHVALQNESNSKYYGQGLGANADDPGNLYLYPWGTLTAKQSGAKSQNEDDPTQSTASSAVTFADNKVFVIGGASDGTVFWNGNPGDIVTWTDGHPFAFYEVETIDIPSGYNVYTGASTTLNQSGWQTQSNWSLTDTWNSNGPGYTNSAMWSPIYLNGVTASGITFEGWNLRIKLVNASLTANTKKFQPDNDGAITFDVDETSALDLTMQGTNDDPNTHTFNIDGSLSIKTVSTHFTGSSTNNVNLGTTGSFTFKADAALTVASAARFTLNATPVASAENTEESRTLATFTNVTVSSLTVNIDGTGGWTQVPSREALTAQTTNGKYYYVDNASTGVTLYTYVVNNDRVYTVNSDATLSQIDSYDNYDRFIVNSGVTLTVDVADFDLTKIEGAGNIVLAASTSLTGNKATAATGKLTVNSGVTLTIGSGDTQTNSVAGFTSIDLLGTIKNNNSTTTLNNVTVPADATGIIYSYDMGTAADGFLLAGTTAVNGTLYVCNRWNFQMKVDQLTGSGTWTICGTTGSDFNASGTSSSEAATINVADSPSFTGTVNMNSTNATTNVNGTLQANTIAGSGKLAGAGTVRLLTFPTTSAPNVTGWTGTVLLPEAGDKANLTAIFNAWGNANSTIQLNSVTGYFNTSQTVNPTLDILSGATVTVNNGSSNNTPVLAKVTGAGTLAQTWSGGSNYTLKIATLTGFTGTLRGTNKPIAVDKLVLASAPASDSETLLISKSGTVTLTNIYVGTEDITGGVTKETRDDGIYSTAYDPVAAKVAVAISILQPYINANAIGTGIGQYTVTMEDGGTVLSIPDEIIADINSRTTLADWENVHITFTINQPQVGHTYAFKGAADSHQYMIDQSSTVTGKTNRLALTATPTGNSHVFTLLEGNKLQSYTSGQYLISTSERYLNVGDEANAVPFEFVASESQIGAYQLKYTYSTYVRTVWSMYTGYVDGADFPQSAIGYQWIIEEVEPKTTSNITYQITEGGTVKWEETIEAGIGDPYPAPTFSHPFVSALAGVPDGEVQDHDETFPLTYTTKYDIAPDVDNITKYYALDIYATSGNYPMYSDGQALRKESSASIDVSKYAQGSADYIYAWAFVGNIFDGIKLYNMEDQKYVCQPADDRNTHISMTSDPDVATAFTVYPNVDVATAFSLKKSDFSYYLNQLGSYVGGWTSADGGSAIRAYEISEFTDSTAHLFDRMKNTAKFDLVAGAVVVSPSEYDEPSAINAAIDAANALSESATRIQKRNFINTLQGQKLYNFLVQSDHYGEPVVVTYVQNRPYGTLIMPLNFACPTGWTRYYCSELTDGGRLVLTDFNSLGIEETKNRPFIIYSPETIGKTYQFIGYSGGAGTEDVTIGLLTGVLSDGGSTVPQGSYVLAYQKSTGLQSFRKTDGTVTCPQYKVYLSKPALAESRDNFYFPDVDDSATGLEELLEQSVLADGKYVRDGRVIIVKNGVKYNTNGQIIK